ncbi:MAG: hypothetical protein K9M80_08625 [Candidatus Marinimicrobia bacterium]|nr:hypothetical protein [Candidatus Neomarinimicrobiota bacterium]
MKKNKYQIILIFTCVLFFMLPLYSQSSNIEGAHEFRWLRIGDLHNWFSNAGAEIEYGRRGRGNFEVDDQLDGMRYYAQYTNYNDHCAAKAIHIGVKNFDDPVTGETYDHKVVGTGPRSANLTNQMMPYEFKMKAKYNHPIVVVDGETATQNAYEDVIDEIDPTIEADRVVINNLHTSIGVDVKRKIHAFSHPEHDNYFIYEYVFKNTGIIDLEGTKIERTLNDVIFHFEYRYGFCEEGSRELGLNFGQGVVWGVATANHSVGPNVGNNPFFAENHTTVDHKYNQINDFNAQYSWFGTHSERGNYAVDVGGTDFENGNILSDPHFIGTATIHADKSATNKENDLTQPRTTGVLGGDGGTTTAGKDIAQYDSHHMTSLYNIMNSSHLDPTHVEQIGYGGHIDEYGDNAGGYMSHQGFGPYDELAPGDSIRIVLVEGVVGINRKLNKEIAFNWYNQNSPYELPDGSSTSDRNEYKNSWVYTGEDSLFQTFENAMNTYNSGRPSAPPPPKDFTVTSGGNMITLEWSNKFANDEGSFPNFEGYNIYRGVGTADTIFRKIKYIDGSSEVYKYEDRSAKRGFDYYYYITTVANGIESSKYWTITNVPAQLQKPPGKELEDIAVVPNPYNISAREFQFGSEGPSRDRIGFFGLPPKCIIKIYTERGDLIKTIKHESGRGDEYWDSFTSSKQMVVSGVYIAYFKVTANEGGFQKGDNTIRKFVIIR